MRHLIAIDAANVMKRLAVRLPEMLGLFSRLRDRGPLLGPIHSWFQTISFDDLAALEPEEQLAVNAFYELLGELRWILQYTEDMPLQLERRVSILLGALRESHRLLAAVIGRPGEPLGRVVEVSHTRRALAPKRAATRRRGGG